MAWTVVGMWIITQWPTKLLNSRNKDFWRWGLRFWTKILWVTWSQCNLDSNLYHLQSPNVVGWFINWYQPLFLSKIQNWALFSRKMARWQWSFWFYIRLLGSMCPQCNLDRNLYPCCSPHLDCWTWICHQPLDMFGQLDTTSSNIHRWNGKMMMIF